MQETDENKKIKMQKQKTKRHGILAVCWLVLALMMTEVAVYFDSIPTPAERRWETYCYADGEKALIHDFPGGLTFVEVPGGQPGWWYLRGEIKRRASSCLLLFYWYQRDMDGDGVKERGFPHAQYVGDGFDHCCDDGGF